MVRHSAHAVGRDRRSRSRRLVTVRRHYTGALNSLLGVAGGTVLVWPLLFGALH